MILGVVMALASVTALVTCRNDSNHPVRTITAETLAEKYRISVEAARREFDGKELLVEGYVIKAADEPKNDEGEGLILLGSEKKVNTQVQCWFTRYEAAEFGSIGPGGSITVKGVFNGEAGPVLKFCKLVKRSVDISTDGS